MQNPQKTKEKILIFGGSSFLAKSFIGKYKDVYDISYTTRNGNLKFDILKDDAETTLPLNKFKIFIIFIGISKISFCENNPEISEKVNHTCMIKLIKSLSKIANKIIFFSTSLVNNLSDARNISKYALQNYEVEKYILNNKSLFKKTFIIRPSKVLSLLIDPTLNFCKSLLCNKNIDAFNDFFITPITLNFLNNYINQIILNKISSGIHCLHSSDSISYYEYAKKIKSFYPNTQSNIIPVTFKNNMYANLSFQKDPFIIDPHRNLVICNQSIDSIFFDLQNELNLHQT